MLYKRLVLTVMWIALTVATSWYVARQVSHDAEESVGINPVDLVSTADREVVSLSETMVAPVISANAMIVPNEDGDGWILEAPVPGDDLAYQLLDEPIGVRALINGGPSGFDCEWIGLGYTGGGISASDAGTSKASAGVPSNATNVTMQCAVPDDIRAAHGMNGMMVLQTAPPTETTTLPLTAVNGSAGQGQVIVVLEDGTTELRTVELGVSDTYNIEILSGLEQDEQVLLYPVQQDFSAAGNP